MTNAGYVSPPYSREATVAAVLDFYKFLGTMGAIPESIVHAAPASGWPSINATAFAALGKNDEVIELLKRLPYVVSNPDGNCKVSYETNVIEYNDEKGMHWCLDTPHRMGLEGILVPVSAGIIPPHIAVLTEGSRYGSWLLLDTQEGTITDYIMFERPEKDSPPRDSPDFWRAYHTMPVADFFEEWKEKFRSLQWVALPHNVDDGMLLSQNSSKVDEIRDIYRAHGWPGNDFRRDECTQALREWEGQLNASS